MRQSKVRAESCRRRRRRFFTTTETGRRANDNKKKKTNHRFIKQNKNLNVQRTFQQISLLSSHYFFKKGVKLDRIGMAM